MATESGTHVELEIGHVLFMDVVGYSKLLINEQREIQRQLTQIVRVTEHFRAAEAAGKLIRLPVGDGMALVFFNSPEAPVQCALEISEALKAYPQLKLRMGIHSGPVSGVTDVNDRSNIAGAGINIAQRIMDCGDAGHILLSKRVADDLAQDGRWRSQLHDLGECPVKHGIGVFVVNLYTGSVGNPQLPEKVKVAQQEEAAAAAASRPPPSVRRRSVFIATAILLAAAVALFIYERQPFPSSARELIPQKSIAVLPFENMSAEKEDAFFADGIHDDVLTSLGKVKELTVIARASVMAYRGAAVSGKLREIGKTLGVSHVLEGSVRRSANRVVLNVRLIDTRDEHQLWSERYDRTLTDSIGLQGELATEIAHALRATLDPEEQARLTTAPTNNPEAYVLYLKAREKERTAASKEDAFAVDAIYDKAIALDSKFAVAMARQSMWNSVRYHVGRGQDQKMKAHALATEALRVAPDLPEAHIAQGFWLRMTERNYDAALKEFSIAAQAIPNDPELLDYIGAIYRRQGRWREAIATFRRAQELDPRVPHEGEAQTAVLLRDWHTATAYYRHRLEVDPDDVPAKINLAYVLMIGEGDFAAAKAVLDQVPNPLRDNAGNPSGDDTVYRWELFMLERDFAGAEKVLVEFPGEEFRPPFVGWKNFAFGCTALASGDAVRAHAFFERARPAYESAVQNHPDESKFLAPLGLLYAYLDRKEDALREGRRAVDLWPEKEAIERPLYLGNLALVYALTGETEQAVTLVEQLLTTPAPGEHAITLTQLRSWRWDGLRSNPRFQKILQGPEPKTVY